MPILLEDDDVLSYTAAMASTFNATLASTGTALLPDEDPDIRREAAKIMDNPDAWLSTPNDNIGGYTPKDLVNDGHDIAVRNLLRTLKYIGMS